MKKLFLILLIGTSFVKAGNELGGAGVAENNLMYAYWNLEVFIDVCLHSHASCSLNAKEYQVLTQIRKNLVEEKKTKDQIIFASESKTKGFFLIDGFVRIAKTEYRVGAPIYINLDLLYPIKTVTAPSTTHILPHDRPLDIPLGAALLVHELGHHLGEKDHAALDLLGTKIQTVLRTYTQELDGGPRRRDILVNAYEYLSTGKSDLIIRDSEKVISLNPSFVPLLKCESGVEPKGYIFWNMHWMKETHSAKESVMPLRVRIAINCGTPELGVKEEKREAIIDLKLKENDKHTWVFENFPTAVKISDCKKSPSECQ